MRPHDVAKAMVGGLLGTLLQTIMVYGVAPLMTGQSMDVAAIAGARLCSGPARTPPQRECDLPAGVCMAVVPSLLWTTSAAGYALGRAHMVCRRGHHGADAGRRGL